MVGILPGFSSSLIRYSLILSRPDTGMVEEYQDVAWAGELWLVVIWYLISQERCTSSQGSQDTQGPGENTQDKQGTLGTQAHKVLGVTQLGLLSLKS